MRDDGIRFLIIFVASLFACDFLIFGIIFIICAFFFICINPPYNQKDNHNPLIRDVSYLFPKE